MALKIKRSFILFCFLKVSIYAICVGLFIYLMKDIWFKYSSKITTTGIRFRLDNANPRPLHCFTIHDFTAFKTKGFYYTNDMIRQNSFTREDIFGVTSHSMFKNASQMITILELQSIYFGTCFTVCINRPLASR